MNQLIQSFAQQAFVRLWHVRWKNDVVNGFYSSEHISGSDSIINVIKDSIQRLNWFWNGKFVCFAGHQF